jgi:hypothetical protein
MCGYRKYIALAILISTPLCCSAGLTGFPLAAGTNTSWYEINAQYSPVSQIYSGIVERCEVVGVTAPQWTHTLAISDTNGATAAITITNALGPVETEFGTAYPRVTHAMLAEMDDAIDALIPEFASTNIYLYPEATGGSYTKPMLFSEIGVGLVSTNVAHVGTNAVTNIVSRWTRSPERRWTENLIEMHYANNGWQLITAEAVEWYDPAATNAAAASVSVVTSTPMPFVSYGPTTTTWSVSLTGIDLYGSNRTETVATGASCTVPWHSITGTPVVSSFDTSITGAWFCVQYTNDLTVYGDRPYRLYASDLDERAAVLAALVRTSVIQSVFTNTYYTNWYGTGLDSSDPTYAAARAEAEGDWQPRPGNLIGPGLHYNYTYESAGRRSRVDSTYYRPYIRNLATNVARSVKFLAYLEPLDQDLDDYEVLEYSDFESGHVTGRWNNVWFGPVNQAADIDSGFWFPASPGTIPLPWTTAIPSTNDVGTVTTMGAIPAYGIKALIEWAFQYK